MNHEVYYLPVNFTDAGRVFGLFEIRNLVEAVLLTLPLLYFCMVLLPLSLTPKLITTMVLVVPSGRPLPSSGSVLTATRLAGLLVALAAGRRTILFRGEIKK